MTPEPHMQDEGENGELSLRLWKSDSEMNPAPDVASGMRLSAPPLLEQSEVEDVTWDDLATGVAGFSHLEGSEHRIRLMPDGKTSSQLDVDALLVARESSKLLVVFHGALQRSKYTLPRFEFKTRLARFDGSVLFVGDPTLYAHRDLGLGWYVGTEHDNGHQLVAKLIRGVMRVVESDNVVLTGSSGGGFAAMAVAPLIDHAVALPFSPQTTIERYYSSHRSRLLTSAFPSAIERPSSIQLHSDRMSVLGNFNGDGNKSSVVYVQNNADTFHIREHLVPFMDSSGLSLGRGALRNDRVSVELAYMRDGHGPPQERQFLSYIDLAFATFGN